MDHMTLRDPVYIQQLECCPWETFGLLGEETEEVILKAFHQFMQNVPEDMPDKEKCLARHFACARVLLDGRTRHIFDGVEDTDEAKRQWADAVRVLYSTPQILNENETTKQAHQKNTVTRDENISSHQPDTSEVQHGLITETKILTITTENVPPTSVLSNDKLINTNEEPCSNLSIFDEKKIVVGMESSLCKVMAELEASNECKKALQISLNDATVRLCEMKKKNSYLVARNEKLKHRLKQLAKYKYESGKKEKAIIGKLQHQLQHHLMNNGGQ